MVAREHVAPAVLALFDQADARSPDRSCASDGTIASRDHTRANPTSDHERGPDGWVDAGDLTDDDAHGLDVRALFAQIVARQDRRVKYLIHEGRMVSSYPARGFDAWQWRPYPGSNGHFKHGHVSVLAAFRHDTSPWWTTRRPTARQEDDMPLDKDTAAYLRAMEDRIKADTQNHVETLLRGATHPNLSKILSLVVKIGAKLGVKA